MLYLIPEPMIQKEVHQNKHDYRVHAGHDEGGPTHSKSHLGNPSSFLPPTTNQVLTGSEVWKPKPVFLPPRQAVKWATQLGSPRESLGVPITALRSSPGLTEQSVGLNLRHCLASQHSASSTRSLSCSTADPNTKSPVTPVDLPLHSSFWWSW